MTANISKEAALTQSTAHVDFPDYKSEVSAAQAELRASRYISPEFAANEWDGIWRKTWLFVGLLEDVKEPGDFFVYEIGHESIVIVQTDANEIRAFFNACQHRGNRVMPSARGAVKKFVCPYHGWTYDLSGKLQTVPDRERFPSCVNWSQKSLKAVRVEVWAGLIWINLDENAKPLAIYFGSILDLLTPYGFERMRLVKHQTLLLEANWKTLKDNFLEQYHVDFIHPQHASLVDCLNSENSLYPFGHSSTWVRGFVTNPRYPIPSKVPELLKVRLNQLGLDPREFEGRVPEIRQAVCDRKRQLGKTLGFDYDGFSDDQVTDLLQVDLFPNLFMTIRPEQVWIYGARPEPGNPDKCRFDKWTLQISGEISVDSERKYNLGVDATMLRFNSDERPEHQVFNLNDVKSGVHSLGITMDQDVNFLPDVQAGMHSQGFSASVLNTDEARLQHFHNWVDVWIGGHAWDQTA